MRSQEQKEVGENCTENRLDCSDEYTEQYKHLCTVFDNF